MKKIYTLIFISVFGFYFSSSQTTQLWGLTSSGGGSDTAGTIFRINLNGSNFGVAYSFDSLSGYGPLASLVQAPNGILYGMTEYGGAGNKDAGVIFDYDPNTNTYNDVFDFDYYTTGGSPEGNSMIMANDKLYGMTTGGGVNNYGTIFSFDPFSNTFVHLYDLGNAGAAYPFGSLMQASNGKLYGLTSEGGDSTKGALFSYSIADSVFTVLHSFTDITGASPYGSLITAGNGKLYGMTSKGGLHGYGVIFSFNIADSLYTKVYDFNDTTGKTPLGSLLSASDNLLYGMTSEGGHDSAGVIFNFDATSNTYVDLYEFHGVDGKAPQGELMQASNSKLYGMTQFGGANDAGVIFSFDQSNDNYVDLFDFNIANGQYPWGDLIEIFTTGIHEKSNTDNIHLYPNPAGKELIIKNGGYGITEIDIFNVLGEKIYSQQPELRTPNSENSIDVNSLSQGVYFVHIYQGQSKWVGKFVKE